MTDSVESATAAAVPQHVAIIMDGNNRWARRKGLSGAAGHKAGVEVIRTVLDVFQQRGVNIVTLFAFSSENWQRPGAEVRALMRLFSNYLNSEVRKLHDDGVSIRFIGRRDRFSQHLQKKMAEAEQLTCQNTRTVLVIAADYGGQWDIARAAQRIGEKVAAGELAVEQIDEHCLDAHTCLADLPKPDLCIRTAGELRLSNFLMWQLAYAELYFSEVLWPDFSATDIDAALTAYASRERRFGGRLSDPGNELLGEGGARA